MTTRKISACIPAQPNYGPQVPVPTLSEVEIELAVDLELKRCMRATTKQERLEAITRALELGAMRTAQRNK